MKLQAVSLRPWPGLKASPPSRIASPPAGLPVRRRRTTSGLAKPTGRPSSRYRVEIGVYATESAPVLVYNLNSAVASKAPGGTNSAKSSDRRSPPAGPTVADARIAASGGTIVMGVPMRCAGRCKWGVPLGRRLSARHSTRDPPPCPDARGRMIRRPKRPGDRPVRKPVTTGVPGVRADWSGVERKDRHDLRDDHDRVHD
jgi:hypothetical protein